MGAPFDNRSGVLVVDKERGITSFAVVSAARRALGIRRIGHAGTLDPEASGVLPVLVGEATKLMPYLADRDKEYVATVRLGVTTDTLDAGGRVVASAPVPALTREDVARAIAPLVGRIRQVPPMYSAVHHGGRRLYELAREGKEVRREARDVVVQSIAVEELAPPIVRLRIVCGKGTYVRVLAADLGSALGCGGVVERLERLRVGPFDRARAIPSSALRPEQRAGLLAQLLPPEAALAGWPVVRLDGRGAASFLHGQAVPVSLPVAGSDRLAEVRRDDETFLGVGQLIAGGSRVRPERIIHADGSGSRVLPA